MRFAWIHVEKATYAVRRLCRVLAVTPSGYYAWMHRLPSQRARDNDRLQVRIRAIHAASRGTYGSPRVHEQLTQEGCAVGRERVARLLRDMGLVGLPARRVRHTTDSTHGRPVAPNVLERHFEADHPNQRWTTDITFIWTWEGWLYLAVVLDLYARRVVGWAVQPHLQTELALEALQLALGRRVALLRGSKTDPQRPLPTDPLTTDSVRRRPTTLSHLIEDVTCEDGLRLLPRPTARSKALPDDQLVPEEGVLHTGLLMVARVLLPLSPSSLLHLSDRAVARGRSWSPSRHGGCPGRWNDDRRATRTRSLVDATRVVGRVRREAGDVAFDLVDQIEGRRRVVNMPAGQGVSDDHARSVDAQMKRLPAAYTASAMFHGRPFTFTHSREPGTVDDEMYACARGEAAKCKVEVLTTP